VTWSPAERADRVVAALWAVTSVAAIAAAPLALALAAHVPACPLRRWTGIACLSCGGTRAMLALARGDLPQALAFNPLVAAAAIAFVAGGLAAPVWIALGGRTPSLTSLSPRVRAAILAGVALSWIWVAAGPTRP
jgi:hypothetical protein